MPGMEAEDATRRTHLANERTHLAWWRTGLTALAVGLAAGRVAPELAGGAAWPFEALGAGYAVLGLGLILYGHQRLSRSSGRSPEGSGRSSLPGSRCR
jgi:putative membrane protein